MHLTRRLRMCLMNDWIGLSSVDWYHKFPSTVLLVLPIQRSDHSPLILNTIPSTQGKTRISRFEAAWLMDIAMKEIVGKVWPTPIQRSQAYSLMKHQQILIKHLRNWHHLQNRSLAARIATTLQQLLEIQQSNDLSSLHLDEQQLRSKSDDLYHQQEVYWSQRARQPWLQRGDKNTKFFHMAASLRSRKKKIMFLKLEDGTFTSDPLQIQQAFLNHFKNIYQTSDAPAQVIHLLDQNNSTWREPLIRTLFPTDMVPHILNIHIPPDIPVWRQSKDGYYSVKSGYFLAIEGCTKEVTVGHDIECDVSKKS